MSEFEKACRLLGIPAHMAERLAAYVDKHEPVGQFLTGVLENNLVEAVCRADEINLPLIKAYVMVLYNDAPSPCWGSKEKVSAWLGARIFPDDPS